MSVRVRRRKDGSAYSQVRFRIDGRETSVSFDDHAEALKLEDLVHRVGAHKALEISRIVAAPERTLTVEQWLLHYIDHLTGVDARTPEAYRSYLRNDIAPTLGLIPLRALTKDDVSRWVQGMDGAGSSGKTIANKHALLSAALAGAVDAGHIPANPAARARLPRDEKLEMTFLTRDQYAHLLGEITEAWRPMVQFLVASGCRIGEATALRPSDVDRDGGTVRISRAWKISQGGYRLGPPKTKKSVRTIDVPAAVLERLDYSGEWLFTNSGRGRRSQGSFVRAANFRMNVWIPAVARSWPSTDTEGNPIQDPLRPRVHDLRHTCASWLIQAGIPLAVVQRHLGHESITTTVDTYGHIDRTSARAAADAIAGMLS